MVEKVFLSNRLESLVDSLEEAIFQGDVFLKRYIVIPSKEMKEFLFREIAKRRGVLSGITFLYTSDLFSLFNIEKKPLLTAFEMGFLIEKEGYKSLAIDLSLLFFRYMEEQKKLEGWQKELFSKVFESYAYPPRDFLKEFKEEIELHVFSFISLPAIYHDFFKAVAERGKVFHYQISFSPLFWTDICSDYERVSLKRWLSKRMDKKRIDALDAYLVDRNPLLANFSMERRNYLRLFEEKELNESFIPPPNGSCLNLIKKDIFEMGFEKRRADSSLRLYGATSKLREIEALFDYIVESGRDFSTFHVLAPNIQDYFPYIRMVFEGFPCHIFHAPVDSFFKEAFLFFFELLLGRFERDQLKKLFLMDGFKSDLSKDEVEEIFDLFENNNIEWGIDPNHQLSFIGKDTFCKNSFEEGLKRLIVSFAHFEEGPDMSDANLIQKFLIQFNRLKAEREFLKNGSLSTLKWALYLEKLAKDLFIKEGKDHFFNFIDALRKNRIEGSFPFDSILMRLKNHLEKSTFTFGAGNVNAITFSTIGEGSVFEKETICLIGMDENFPQIKRSPLDESEKSLSREKDLFLEAICMAQKELYLSYVAFDEDGRRKNSSSLIESLSLFVEGLETIFVPPNPFVTFNEKRKDVSLANYMGALSLYEGEKRVPFFMKREPVLEEEIIIEVKDLLSFASHPLRFYLNQKLKLFFPQKEEEGLSFLQKHLIKKELFQKSPDLIMRELEDGGFFKDSFLRLEKDMLLSELVSISSKLEEIGGVFENEVMLSYEVLGKRVKITGKLDSLSQKGLIFLKKFSLADVISSWPAILIFLELKGYPPDMFFIRDGSVKRAISSEKALKDYLAYFLKSKTYPSLFVKPWIEPLIKKRELNNFYKDPYLDWFVKREEVDKETHFEVAKSLFLPYLREWGWYEKI